MLETTTIMVETATVVGATSSTGSLKIKKDADGKPEALLVNKKRSTIGTGLATTATSATTAAQESSYQKTLNDIRKAQAYVESMSDEKLVETLAALDLLEASADFTTNSKNK